MRHPTRRTRENRTITVDFRTRWSRARQRQHGRGFALGQRWRRLADHVTHTAGEAHGNRGRQWVQAKQAAWYAGLADPPLPVPSTL